MKISSHAAALVALLAGSAAMPAPALAAVHGAGTFTFATTLTDVRDNLPGAYEGILNLRISPDGIVQGRYRALDDAREQTVTGGLKGTQLWLEIGDAGGFHIDGTFTGGKIDGYTQLPGIRAYEFKATPIGTQQ